MTAIKIADKGYFLECSQGTRDFILFPEFKSSLCSAKVMNCTSVERVNKNNRLFLYSHFSDIVVLTSGQRQAKAARLMELALMEDRYDDKYLMLLTGCCAQNESYGTCTSYHDKRYSLAPNPTLHLCVQ